jgi:hypothetical protein
MVVYSGNDNDNHESPLYSLQSELSRLFILGMTTTIMKVHSASLECTFMIVYSGNDDDNHQNSLCKLRVNFHDCRLHS